MTYILFSACIGRPELRARGITHDSDLKAYKKALDRCREHGIEAVFLPCPETEYLGKDRAPGSYLERLNTPEFESIMKREHDEVMKMIQERYEKTGEKPLCIVGVDSSPACGVNKTYYTDVKENGRGAFLKQFNIPAIDVKDFAKYRVYLAAPLFSQAEREFNLRLAEKLRAAGFSVHLPQETGDDTASRGDDGITGIFDSNLRAINESDYIIAVIDGADADSGTSWEIGYAFAKGIDVIMLRTDFRRAGDNEDVNLMLEKSGKVVHSEDELISYLCRRV